VIPVTEGKQDSYRDKKLRKAEDSANTSEFRSPERKREPSVSEHENNPSKDAGIKSNPLKEKKIQVRRRQLRADAEFAPSDSTGDTGDSSGDNAVGTGKGTSDGGGSGNQPPPTVNGDGDPITFNVSSSSLLEQLQAKGREFAVIARRVARILLSDLHDSSAVPRLVDSQLAIRLIEEGDFRAWVIEALWTDSEKDLRYLTHIAKKHIDDHKWYRKIPEESKGITDYFAVNGTGSIIAELKKIAAERKSFKLYDNIQKIKPVERQEALLKLLATLSYYEVRIEGVLTEDVWFSKIAKKTPEVLVFLVGIGAQEKVAKVLADNPGIVIQHQFEQAGLNWKDISEKLEKNHWTEFITEKGLAEYPPGIVAKHQFEQSGLLWKDVPELVRNNGMMRVTINLNEVKKPMTSVFAGDFDKVFNILVQSSEEKTVFLGGLDHTLPTGELPIFDYAAYKDAYFKLTVEEMGGIPIPNLRLQRVPQMYIDPFDVTLQGHFPPDIVLCMLSPLTQGQISDIEGMQNEYSPRFADFGAMLRQGNVNLVQYSKDYENVYTLLVTPF
jgi:hypothetical protein